MGDEFQKPAGWTHRSWGQRLGYMAKRIAEPPRCRQTDEQRARALAKAQRFQKAADRELGRAETADE